MLTTNNPSLLKRASDSLQAGDFDLTISLCTDVLNNTSLSSNEKTGALKTRAKAYKYKHAYELALCDYDTLVGMHPRLPRSYADRGGVHILIGEGASLMKGVSDLAKCQELSDDYGDPGIEQIFRMLFNLYSKANILAAIKCLPDKNKVTSLLKDCLNKSEYTYFGRHFWIAKGLRECRLGRGSLGDISAYLWQLANYTAEEWYKLGKDSHAFNDYFSAIEAYSAALFLVQDKEVKATLHIASGDAWACMGWRREAVADYHEAIKYNSHAGVAYIKRVLILSSSSHPEDLKQCIHYLEDIYARLKDKSLYLSQKENGWLNQCVTDLFGIHGKNKVFEAIKLFEPAQQIDLLEACQSKDHYLGRHFWKNRYLFTECSLESGTLAKIVAHLNTLRGVEQPVAVSVSVGGIFGSDQKVYDQEMNQLHSDVSVKRNY